MKLESKNGKLFLETEYTTGNKATHNREFFEFHYYDNGNMEIVRGSSL